MSIVSDKKRREETDESDLAERSDADVEPAGSASSATRERAEDEGPISDEELEAQVALAAAEAEQQALEEASGIGDAPVVFGTQRFVFAAYFAGAIGAAFIGTKALTALWRLVAKYKPSFGEPKEELVYAISGALGIALALYYWKKPSARNYADEVAEELGKVTWPSKKEVQSSTIVVVATTIGAAVFFAVLDLMWRYVTDKIYGT
jgi:preprotein translocase SecE subunit